MNDRYGPQLFLVLLALAGFVALVGGISHLDDPTGPGAPQPTPAPASPFASGSARPGVALSTLR